jgi:hypothetical protein
VRLGGEVAFEQVEESFAALAVDVTQVV